MNIKKDIAEIVGWSPSQIAQELANGNPVIMWGVAGNRPRRIFWQTPEGKTVQAALIEHARVITGSPARPIIQTDFSR